VSSTRLLAQTKLPSRLQPSWRSYAHVAMRRRPGMSGAAAGSSGSLSAGGGGGSEWRSRARTGMARGQWMALPRWSHALWNCAGLRCTQAAYAHAVVRQPCDVGTRHIVGLGLGRLEER
jgi:hypothetical protein